MKKSSHIVAGHIDEIGQFFADTDTLIIVVLDMNLTISTHNECFKNLLKVKQDIAGEKIRDDAGYWNQLERFITEHSEAQFSHSICAACAKLHYPD